MLSLPIALRYHLAYDSRLAAEVLHLFMRAVFASLRRRAWRFHVPRNCSTGFYPYEDHALGTDPAISDNQSLFAEIHRCFLLVFNC